MSFVSSELNHIERALKPLGAKLVRGVTTTVPKHEISVSITVIVRIFGGMDNLLITAVVTFVRSRNSF